jgi:endonuclease YncB( thermonuclease family)
MTNHTRVARSLRSALALVAFGVLAANLCATEQLRGRVTRVFDGDSCLVRLERGGVIEVRLAEIDAPEKDQPYADEARSALRELVLDRDLDLEVIDEDKYERKVARVRLVSNRMNVNAELVNRGHAWVYRYHLRDRSLLDLEQAARSAKRGLWALPDDERMPPWKWRRAHPRT